MLSTEAITGLRIAIDILTEKGRFQVAATHQKSLAEIYKVDLADLEQAMAAYELAGDWYLVEESPR